MKPAKREAPAAATAQGFGDGSNDEGSHSPGAPLAGQALQVIEGETKAREFLGRLRAEQADAHDLGVIVSMLYGPRLRGFCSVITKALTEAAPGGAMGAPAKRTARRDRHGA